MEIYETIRAIRKFNNLTQEEMAEKLGLSVNGYFKIERGQSKLSLEKLEQIAAIFNVNVAELYAGKDKSFFYFLSEHNGSNYYSSDEKLLAENNELKLVLHHKTEMLDRVLKENEMLKELIDLLKKNIEEK